jgi:L-amino acid N-acyltransferase YncA
VTNRGIGGAGGTPGGRVPIIRDALPSDALAIVAILNPIIAARTHTVFDEPFSVEAEREYLLRFPARGIWKIAERGGRVVGFQVLEPFATYTRAFDHVGTLGTYVDLTERRQGVASALFSATLEAARVKGYEKIFTFVRADNQAALATYQAHQFAVIGTARRHAKIDGRYIDELLIERSLTDRDALQDLHGETTGRRSLHNPHGHDP